MQFPLSRFFWSSKVEAKLVVTQTWKIWSFAKYVKNGNKDDAEGLLCLVFCCFCPCLIPIGCCYYFYEKWSGPIWNIKIKYVPLNCPVQRSFLNPLLLFCYFTNCNCHNNVQICRFCILFLFLLATCVILYLSFMKHKDYI